MVAHTATRSRLLSLLSYALFLFPPLSSGLTPPMLLSSLPSGSMVLELSQCENSLSARRLDDNASSASLCSLDDELFASPSLDAVLTPGTCFVHGTVTETTVRDAMDARFGSGKAVTVGTLDVGPVLAPMLAATSCKPEESVTGTSYLGLGLNHHVGGYYYARGLGTGAAAPAQGIGLRTPAAGEGLELFWYLRRKELTGAADPGNLPLEARVNSNDGKRSEWVDFLRRGDTVQIIPASPAAALQALGEARGQAVYGVRREGRPKGSEPAVERKWVITGGDEEGQRWVPAEL